MSYICKVRFDGTEVSNGGHVTSNWAKYHYIDLEFKCELPLEPCHEEFVIYVDGVKRWTTGTIDIPGALIPQFAECRPVSIQLTNAGDILDPGDHLVKIEVVEHPLIGNPYTIQTYQFTVTIEKEENQTTPSETPKVAQYTILDWLNKSYFGIPLWAWTAIGIVGIAIFTKPPEEFKEIKELMKLKLMKELAEEE